MRRWMHCAHAVIGRTSAVALPAVHSCMQHRPSKRLRARCMIFQSFSSTAATDGKITELISCGRVVEAVEAVIRLCCNHEATMHQIYTALRAEHSSYTVTLASNISKLNRIPHRMRAFVSHAMVDEHTVAGLIEHLTTTDDLSQQRTAMHLGVMYAAYHSLMSGSVTENGWIVCNNTANTVLASLLDRLTHANPACASALADIILRTYKTGIVPSNYNLVKVMHVLRREDPSIRIKLLLDVIRAAGQQPAMLKALKNGMFSGDLQLADVVKVCLQGLHRDRLGAMYAMQIYSDVIETTCMPLSAGNIVQISGFLAALGEPEAAYHLWKLYHETLSAVMSVCKSHPFDPRPEVMRYIQQIAPAHEKVLATPLNKYSIPAGIVTFKRASIGPMEVLFDGLGLIQTATNLMKSSQTDAKTNAQAAHRAVCDSVLQCIYNASRRESNIECISNATEILRSLSDFRISVDARLKEVGLRIAVRHGNPCQISSYVSKVLENSSDSSIRCLTSMLATSLAKQADPADIHRLADAILHRSGWKQVAIGDAQDLARVVLPQLRQWGDEEVGKMMNTQHLSIPSSSQSLRTVWLPPDAGAVDAENNQQQHQQQAVENALDAVAFSVVLRSVAAAKDYESAISLIMYFCHGFMHRREGYFTPDVMNQVLDVVTKLFGPVFAMNVAQMLFKRAVWSTAASNFAWPSRLYHRMLHIARDCSAAGTPTAFDFAMLTYGSAMPSFSTNETSRQSVREKAFADILHVIVTRLRYFHSHPAFHEVPVFPRHAIAPQQLYFMAARKVLSDMALAGVIPSEPSFRTAMEALLLVSSIPNCLDSTASTKTTRNTQSMAVVPTDTLSLPWWQQDAPLENVNAVKTLSSKLLSCQELSSMAQRRRWLQDVLYVVGIPHQLITAKNAQSIVAA